MQQFWITASKALSLVTGALQSDYGAMLAICERAYAGLLKSTAEVLIVGGERREHAEIATSFWWAKGHEALEQDWQRGDFRTVIDRRVEVRAFGVRFDFDGISKLLTVEAAASALRDLSVSSDANWIDSRAARRFMYEVAGSAPTSAGAELIEKCRLGFVPARAQLMSSSYDGRSQKREYEEREWDIPAWFWQNFTTDGSSAQNWASGIFSGNGSTPSGRAADAKRNPDRAQESN